MNYYFVECYNKYRPHADVEGFVDCAYDLLLKKLNYPLDQHTVRLHPLYQVYRNDVYNFAIECNKPPYKALRRVPITQTRCKW